MDLSELLERVEKASGPDRELDAELCLALGDFPQIQVSWTGGPFRSDLDGGWRLRPQSKGYVEHPLWIDSWGRPIGAQAKPYTASVDAALALVERVLPGWGVVITKPLDGGGYAEVFSREGLSFDPNGDKNVSLGEWLEQGKPQRETPALALLAAMLRALIAGNAELQSDPKRSEPPSPLPGEEQKDLT